MMIEYLIISHNDDVGFYCDGFNDPVFFHKVLFQLVDKYGLKTHKLKNNQLVSDIESYFSVRELNADKFNILLQEEDGSDWVFG